MSSREERIVHSKNRDDDTSTNIVSKAPTDAIFIWIPKVAGTSMASLLESEGADILKRQSLLKRCNNRGITCFGHMNVTKLISIGVIDREYFDRAFKFCVVRNPWDRCVSLYSYLTRISSRGKSVIESNTSFPGFCARLMLARLPFVGFKIPPVGTKHVEHLSQCNPQIDWITDSDGKIFVDFVARYENLEADVHTIKTRLGIQGELPLKNRMARTREYRPYYNHATKRAVGYVYKRDIDAFGYEF